jgi:hypothetical protein
MRGKIRKELLLRFRQELKKRLPQFQLSKRTHPGDPLWEWHIAPKLTFFLHLQPFDKVDEFILDIAWNETKKYPVSVIGFSFPPNIKAPTCNLRLAQLWARGPLADAWCVVPKETEEEEKARYAALQRGDTKTFFYRPPEEEVLPRVGPLVEDAVQKLIDFGIPLFRKVAKHRGIAWPL